MEIPELMLTDDGTTLLAVRQRIDGTLELVSTPVTIVQDTYDNSTQFLKVSNTDILLNQIRYNTLPKINQQSSLSSIDVIDLQSEHFQVANEEESQPPELTNNTLPKNRNHETNIQVATDVNKLDEEHTSKRLQVYSSKEASPSLEKSSPSSKKYARKSIGRPKKNNKNADGEQAWFKCDICGKGFKKQYLMQKHMHEHAQEKPHHCPKCPASFNVPTNFTLHMATHNIGEPRCPQCGRKFARMASLKAHMSMHEVDENLYCTECEDGFETKAQLDAHLKLHNEKWSTDDYRRCKLCRKQFTQPVLYRQHLRDHYKMQTKCTKQTKRGIRPGTIYKCRVCLKTFEKPSQLVRHLRVHTGEKPYKCNLCNRSFTQKGSVRIHMWQHNGIRPYSCSYCKAKFSQKGNLNAHILRVHNVQEGSTMYRCTRCPCIFKKLGSLNGHMKRVHAAVSEQQPHVEDEPDKEAEEADGADEEEDREESQQETSLAWTMDEAQAEDVARTSEDDTGRQGDDGGKEDESALPKNFEDGFVVTNDKEQTAVVTLLDKMSNDAKGKYIKIKQRFVNNSRLYECDHCDKTFKKPSDLMRHLRIHTREKPFKCKTCSRSFTLKSTMLSHEKVHENAGKYACQTCDMTFNTENALRSHEKVHNKIHRCRLCSKNFSSFDRLKEHATSTHMPGRKQQQQSDRSSKAQQLAPEVQSLAPKVVLKEPLVLTEVSNGLLHAQPKFRAELAHGKGRPHKCPACPAAFTKLSHLKQHHRKHTGERPYTCALCDRRFTTNSALKAHRRTHDLLKPYQCTICNTNFSTLSSMKRHHITHSNKRPYMCPYCNKTFKTTVNCRKHMKLHKQEIALQQLELQKKQQQSLSSNSNHIETINVTDSMPISDQQITFKPIATDLTQNLNEQLQTMNKNKSSLPDAPSLQNIHVSCHQGQNISIVDNSNIGSTQTLHADETGTITLSNYTGDQTLTPESIREIEETLNQQLFNIGMNMALNSSVRQIEEHNNTALGTRDQPILSIIYDNSKTIGPPITTPMNTNIFCPQFDAFDINQITLQGDNEIGMGITQTDSANMTSILPNSIQQNQTYNLQLVNNDFEINAVLKQSQLNNLKDNQLVSNSFTPRVQKEQVCESKNKNLDKENNLQCHMCNVRELSADDLKEHLKTHEDNKEYQCTHCLSKFCTSIGLSRHMKIHELQETHKCYECNQEFSTTLQLREHIKDHVKHELELKNVIDSDSIFNDLELKNNDEAASKKNKMCKYCPKTFRKPSDLIRHVRTHTGERPYRCQYCEKSFAVKCTLDSHLKVHGGEKSYHCHVCDSMFATRGSLKVHMRLHTGTKPFKCTMCDMRFRTSGHRKVHLNSHMRESNPPSKEKLTDSPNASIEKPDDQSEDDDRIVQIVHTVPMSQQQQHQFENLNSTITINSAGDQVTLSSADDGSGLLALNENNQLVANLEFLLANGLVTIQTDDPSIMPSQLPLSSAGLAHNDFVATNVVQKVNEQATSDNDNDDNDADESPAIFTAELPTDQMNSGLQDPNGAGDGDFQLNNLNCLVLQLDDVSPAQELHSDEGDCPKETRSPSYSGGSTPRRECDVCGKQFAKPCQLERHRRVHTGERPFKCQLCDKSFAQKSTLQMHQKHHTGERPHACPCCDRSFTQSGNLQTHLRRKHKLLEPAAAIKLQQQQQQQQQQFVSYYDPKLVQLLQLQQQQQQQQQQQIFGVEQRPLSFEDISLVELLN